MHNSVCINCILYIIIIHVYTYIHVSTVLALVRPARLIKALSAIIKCSLEFYLHRVQQSTCMSHPKIFLQKGAHSPPISTLLWSISQDHPPSCSTPPKEMFHDKTLLRILCLQNVVHVQAHGYNPPKGWFVNKQVQIYLCTAGFAQAYVHEPWIVEYNPRNSCTVCV